MSLSWNIYGLDDIDEDDALDEDDIRHTYYPHRCKKCKGICKFDEDGYPVNPEDEDDDWEQDDEVNEIAEK